MTLVKWIAAGSVAMMMNAGAAFAAEKCTDAMLEERQEALVAYLKDNPEKAEKMQDAVKTVEAKYGGEPPRDQQCKAMDELMEEVKKL